MTRGVRGELLDKLDEVDNPEGGTWTVRGPLHLEFTLPVRFRLDRPENEDAPVRPEEIVLEEIGEGLEYGQLDVRARGTDPPTAALLREALLADLEPLVKASWRWHNVKRREDPAAQLAQYPGDLGSERRVHDRAGPAGRTRAAPQAEGGAPEAVVRQEEGELPGD